MQILYWFSLKTPPMNIYLIPIYDHICIMLEFCNDITFHHIYRNLKTCVDHLSKQGLQLVEGTTTPLDINKDFIKEIDMGFINV